jgi:TonB family protein
MACTIASTLLWCSWCFGQREQGEIKRKIVNKVAPMHPELARKMNISGSVRVEVGVAPNGSVKSDKIVGGHPVHAQSAEDAIRKWKWAPNAQEPTELLDIKFDLKNLRSPQRRCPHLRVAGVVEGKLVHEKCYGQSSPESQPQTIRTALWLEDLLAK